MRRSLAATLVATALVVSSTALAATVQDIEGTVSIRSEGGFQKITAPVEVELGDTVMASPNGRAKIVYSDQCWMEVHPGEVVVVTDVTCTNSDDSSIRGSMPTDVPVNTRIPWVEAGIVVAIGGIIGCAAAWCRSDDPTSP